MKQTTLIITALAALFVIGLLFSGASAVNAQSTTSATPAIDVLLGVIREFEALPSGQSFSYTFPEDILNQAAEEAIKKYEKQLKSLLRSYTNMDLSVAKPKVDFKPVNGDDANVLLSIKAGYGFVKLTLKADGLLLLENGIPTIEVLKVDIPIVSVPLDKVNTQLGYYLNVYGLDYLKRNVTLTKVETTNDAIIVEGIRN